MPQEEIILYDLPRREMEKGPWSPNTLKARFALEFKGLPYKTVWIEYPDVAAHCQKIGAKPTGKWPDGTPLYTLPVIQDPNTDAVVSDSYAIAEYLDAHYATPRSLIPAGTEGLHAAFFKAITDNAFAKLFPIIPAAVAKLLNPPSAEYFVRTREAQFGKLDEFCPPGPKREQQLKEAKAGLDIVEGWYQKAGKDTLYLMGDTPSWADLIVAAYMVGMKRMQGEHSDEWKQISSWNSGRWAKLAEALGS
ncbi:hypothetical protein GLOTRDRAFT_109364 [Gloeophyllum trabeum ATCC 11539]|uniref:GST N-terminal domain-containing protein n=1 Tax=Gloeophyllum trabeum (strain ATCC 11539 / FP-39264 / Madison 617) TaxID=670483 RepID=S7QNX7_GLOTA|nr:uncharacterized protein GLOTRDRAFT_109364 [Gloeophyllum trabeum ATCC 11539]EPQ61228.1 hypothetical protein GLOTRDRAFT_109364 [Gloeophyllum trabeum ATCC 11539]